MKAKKICVNLTPENQERLVRIMEKSGLSQTEIVNHAIAEAPIVCLGDRHTIAQSFFDIRNMLQHAEETEIRGEVQDACQSLNLLMAKIEELTH